MSNTESCPHCGDWTDWDEVFGFCPEWEVPEPGTHTFDGKCPDCGSILQLEVEIQVWGTVKLIEARDDYEEGEEEDEDETDDDG